MKVCEFCRLLFGKQNDIMNEKNQQENFKIQDDYLLRVVNYLSNKGIEEKERYARELINNPTLKNGKLYELLAYAWLFDSHMLVESQVLIDSSECLKEEPYYADGLLENRVVFEIKKFGIGLGLYSYFQKRLQKISPDYFIMVGGGKNLSSKVIEKELIGKIEEWKGKLFNEENRNGTDYIYSDKDYALEIRACKKRKGEMQILTSISEIDNAQWAQENELYFFRHGSQFCSDRPYIIICPFLPADTFFSGKTNEDLYLMFRFLCRRMFMHVLKETQRKLKEIDGKAKADVSLATASRKLSAVAFLDISEKWDCNNCRCWVYINPNADFPVPNYIIGTYFRYAGAYIDAFLYDNY